MSDDVFEMIKVMDRRNVELQLLLQCAPTIAGLKTSNLLIVPREDENSVRLVLKNTGLLNYRLAYDRKRVVFLVFNRKLLSDYLDRQENISFLKSIGYTSLDFGYILRTFQRRYNTYIADKTQFPHEMGLLLGYPLEDVTGFIKNKGDNYKLLGYWKVYSNVEKASSLFASFDSAKDDMIRRLSWGLGFSDIVNYYKNFGFSNVREAV